jgi:broad specificity phosphatase PhoE
VPFSKRNKVNREVTLHEWSFGAYNGLSWEKIREYMEQKYPPDEYAGLEFRYQQVWLSNGSGMRLDH